MEPIVESRKYFMGCNIAGFAYGEGCIVMDELKVSTQVQLMRDNYNKFDPLAISIVEALEVLTNKDSNYWEKVALKLTQKNENK